VKNIWTGGDNEIEQNQKLASANHEREGKLDHRRELYQKLTRRKIDRWEGRAQRKIKEKLNNRYNGRERNNALSASKKKNPTVFWRTQRKI
jgi:hypothetical protein